MKIENGNLVFDTENIKSLKITGHRFVDIMGYNSFNSKGDCLVKMFLGIKDTIDPYFTKRGDIGEQISLAFLKEKGYNVVRYKAKEVDYDMFKHLADVGGIIDIEAKDLKWLWECKSKSYEDYYDKMVNKGERFKHEEEQAKLYYTYRGSEKAFMIYVFFREQAKLAIENNLPLRKEWFEVWGYELKDIDKEEIEMQVDYATFYRDSCYDSKSIPIEDISPKMIEYLKINYGLVV